MGYNFISTVAHQWFSIPFTLEEVNFDHLLPIKWSIIAFPLPNDYLFHASLGTWPVEMAQVSPNSQHTSLICHMRFETSLHIPHWNTKLFKNRHPRSSFYITDFPIFSTSSTFLILLLSPLGNPDAWNSHTGNIISVQPFSQGLCVALTKSFWWASDRPSHSIPSVKQLK